MNFEMGHFDSMGLWFVQDRFLEVANSLGAHVAWIQDCCVFYPRSWSFYVLFFLGHVCAMIVLVSNGLLSSWPPSGFYCHGLSCGHVLSGSDAEAKPGVGVYIVFLCSLALIVTRTLRHFILFFLYHELFPCRLLLSQVFSCYSRATAFTNHMHEPCATIRQIKSSGTKSCVERMKKIETQTCVM